MKLFNAFLAVALYTAAPFVAQYLFSVGYSVAGYVVAGGTAVGYIVLSCFIEDNS